MRKGLLILLATGNIAHAGIPVWTFSPLTPTSVSVPGNGTATIQYLVTNQSKKTHTLMLKLIQGVSQDVSAGYCKNPFILGYQQSCALKLNVSGRQLLGNIIGGPVVCEQGIYSLECYQPSAANQLDIQLLNPITTAIISVSGSPLTLTTNGVSGTIIVTNTSSELAATNVTAILTGTALDGYVTVNSSNCNNIPALGSCDLIFTPSSTEVPLTSFSIQGSNTSSVSAGIAIQQAVTLTSISPLTSATVGGTGVTLTGAGLTNAFSVNFDGLPATNVHVVDSNTVTAVTPAHSVGPVDVVITTPSGSATLPNGYTYVATTVGQPAFGGVIACLESTNNLIAAVSDISTSSQWGDNTTQTHATSTIDGLYNTNTIVSALGIGSTYAALLCDNYEVDSQGNSPCQTGNACYSDWFLPAGSNPTSTGQLNCLYNNKSAIGNFDFSPYWSSTEKTTTNAWAQNFLGGAEFNTDKSTSYHVRCVRSF